MSRTYRRRGQRHEYCWVLFDRRLRTFNDKQFRRWLADPEYDPVFEVQHRHAANWAWW